MPLYVLLQKYTDQGRKSMRDTPANIKRNIQNALGSGAEVHDVILTFGRYDIVSIAEFPSDEAAFKVVARLAEQGNAKTTLLRGFSLDEAERIFAQ